MTDYEHFVSNGKVKFGSCKLLTADSVVGDYVHWKPVAGDVLTGFLKEWDNGTAIIQTGTGKQYAVRCR